MQTNLMRYLEKCDLARESNMPNMPSFLEGTQQMFSLHPDLEFENVAILFDDLNSELESSCLNSALENGISILRIQLDMVPLAVAEFLVCGAALMLYDSHLLPEHDWPLALISRMAMLCNVPIYGIGVVNASAVLQWHTSGSVNPERLPEFLLNFGDDSIKLQFVWDGKKVGFLPGMEIWLGREDKIERYKRILQQAMNLNMPRSLYTALIERDRVVSMKRN